MKPMMILAVINAIVWSGIITFLLFRMMSNQQDIELQVDRVERKLGDPEAKRP